MEFIQRAIFGNCGVGINISREAPFTVQLLHEGRSAHRSGLIKPGDVIVSIAGESLQGKSVDQLTGLMLGPPSSPVELGLSRGSVLLRVWLLRSPSKLTQVEVQKQRDLQSKRGGVSQQSSRSSVHRQASRMTDTSYLMSQASIGSLGEEASIGSSGEESYRASIGSLGEESYRELGNEQSFDPDRLHLEASIMSQYSFHGGGGAESEKSFDPDAMYGERSLAMISEKSFDPEMLVTNLCAQDSFDPDRDGVYPEASDASFDPDRMGFLVSPAKVCQEASDASFDPDRMGFLVQEESFDPEREEQRRSLVFSVSSEMSFDPERLYLERSGVSLGEKSYDPENDARVYPENSDMSFDPERLHYEDSRYTIASQNSFDPERSQASMHSEQSFDPEQASMRSEASYDPESSQGSMREDKSFDPDLSTTLPGTSSELSFDPDRSNASIQSDQSFDPERKHASEEEGEEDEEAHGDERRA
ncbi:hypothetical protein T484DRAFT_1845960 [Baffinella frigidus]|nr:hypothetical protein T484DRAFT_1845960 [Cryptophyta sp. CCMP2293]